MQISGRTVLITGASRGIGAACAAEFRRRGAKLALLARDEQKLRTVAREGELILAADLTDDAARRAAADKALATFGTIDILINNAGVGAYAPSWETSMDDARRLFELNFFAPLAMAQLLIPAMRAKRSGCIVNVGSIAGKVTLPWLTLYSASKYALGSWTDGLRMELRDTGIHALIVCPGYVKTEFQENVLGGAPPAPIRKGRPFAITAEQCAAAIANGIERNARTVVTPKVGWLMVAAARLFPGVVDRVMANTNRGLAAEADEAP